MTCDICTHIADHDWDGLSNKAHCSSNPRLGIEGCHATWGGSRIHSPCCHRTWASDATERRYHFTRGLVCRSDDELTTKGAVLRDGIWGSPSPVGAPWRANPTVVAPSTDPGNLVASR